MILLSLGGAEPSRAAIVELAGQTEARVGWAAAPGSVAGYAIYTNRNQSGFQLAGHSAAFERTFLIEASFGDTVRVRVAAIGPTGIHGQLSPPSDGLFFKAIGTDLANPSSTDRATVLIGSESGGGATIEAYRLDGSLASVASYSASELPAGIDLSSIAEVRGASCDLLGNGVRSFVFGFGSGSAAYVEIRAGIDGGMVHDRWIQVEPGAYASENGETHPACGDLDGDGRDEIVVGLGQGGGGRVRIYDDSLNNNVFMKELAIQWPDYADANGESRPALGDIDGDGWDEIVLGLGTGGNGFMMVYDDAPHLYRRYPTNYGSGWLLAEWPEYEAENGETYPSLGDVDGDGVDEIVVGFGRGGNGRLRVYDDLTGYFQPYATLPDGFTDVSYGVYQGLVGITRPHVVDLDLDGEAETLVGLGADVFGRIRSTGLIRVLSSASGGFTPATHLADQGRLEIEAWHQTERGAEIVAR